MNTLKNFQIRRLERLARENQGCGQIAMAKLKWPVKASALGQVVKPFAQREERINKMLDEARTR